MESVLISSVPLLLAGLGALITELSGMLGLFMEGFINMGAFFSLVITGWTGSVYAGIFLSALLAMLAGWGLAVFVRITGANPFIVGLAVNLASSGVVNTLSNTWFGTRGVLRNPVSYNIPKYFLLYVSAFFLIAAIIFLKKTRAGFRLIASGKAPLACVERGIKPENYREAAWAIAAFLSALGGAALTFRIGAYTPGGAAGRGWIAIVIVYLGFRRVWGVAAAALLFSFLEKISYSMQGIGTLPVTLIIGLPSALALVLYMVYVWAGKKRISLHRKI